MALMEWLREVLAGIAKTRLLAGSSLAKPPVSLRIRSVSATISLVQPLRNRAGRRYQYRNAESLSRLECSIVDMSRQRHQYNSLPRIPPETLPWPALPLNIALQDLNLNDSYANNIPVTILLYARNEPSQPQVRWRVSSSPDAVGGGG